MRAVRSVAVMVVWGTLAAVGCQSLYTRPTARTAPQPAAALVDDDERLEWATEEPWMIVVRKTCRTLDVYKFGARVRSFAAVFGLSGGGSKLFEGDLRTPTGFYTIVDKRPHRRWRHFMLLDYPNASDLHRYWLAMEAGDLPLRGDHYVGVGGAVGIHGTDKPWLNSRSVDWTLGCISLQNADIEDLAALVPVGTPVLIEE